MKQKMNSDDNFIKTLILTEKFFSERDQADLSDINEKVSVNFMLNILSAVTVKQIEQIINKLLNKKVLSSNSISNKVFKTVVSLIKKNLVQTISKCFDSELTSESFCEFTTVVLQKKRKKDYSLLSSYCFIALENTLAKLMKKLIAEQITCTVKMHSFLL